jgi:hypothetical protein
VLFGLVAALATISAALTFGANLDRFVGTPSRWGWTWDAMLEEAQPLAPGSVERVVQDRAFTGVSAGTRGEVVISGQPITSYGLEQLRGDVGPVATKGRLPSAPNEVAMGAQTLRELHRSVGDTVVATTGEGENVRLRIVGRTLLPSMSEVTALGAEHGALFTTETLYRLNPQFDGEVNFLLVDFAPGTTLREVQQRYVKHEMGAAGPSKPGDIGSYDQVSSTSLVLVGVVTVLGVGVLMHLLVTSVRARRRELAILKCIGFTRRQVMATVGWQAVALVVAAVAFGLPLGVAGGRRAWQSFAEYLGADAPPEVPLLAFVLVGALTIALTIVIAAFPARAAARTRPATVLAVE